MNRALLTIFAALGLTGCAAQIDGAPRFIGAGAPVGDYSLALTPLAESRFDGVVRQKYDFSCGSAALATLLRYHYDFDVREENAFRGMWAEGDRERIRAVGFSLLDMKRWLASRGLKADGYEVDLAAVAQTGIPGIALIETRGYKHFVVVKGVRGDEILLGDPSLGLTVMPRAKFVESWNGIYFVLSDEQDRAKQAFSTDRQWASYVRAPVGYNFADPVSQQALMLTAPFYGDF